MPLRLSAAPTDPLRFADHAVSRLRPEPSRRKALATRLRTQPWIASSHGKSERDNRALLTPTPEEPGIQRSGRCEPASSEIRDPTPDHAVARAQAEAEDVALVRLAAARLAVALWEVSLLLRGADGATRSDALERCTAKGWMKLEGDPIATSQTFRVTSEGYRAVGLRPPPFVS